LAAQKKDIDYWDKYYGKKGADGYPKKDSYSGKNSRGRIIGSEYKVKPPPKKKKRSPALTIILLLIIVFLAGFFTFYAIDRGFFTKLKPENLTAAQVDDTASNESTISQEQDSSSTKSEETSSSSENSDAGSINDPDTKKVSFWQQLIYLIKNFGKEKLEDSDYPKKITLNCYFAVTGEQKIFGAEKRTIVAGSPQNAAVNAMGELLKGPYASFYYPVIAPGTKVLGAQVSDKVLRLNLSQEFISESLDSRILDEYVIYTIVNTLTEIQGIQAVVFLVDGREIKQYGLIDLRLPAIRQEKYLPK